VNFFLSFVYHIGAANAVDFFISQQDVPFEFMVPTSGKSTTTGSGLGHSLSGSNSGMTTPTMTPSGNISRRKASDMDDSGQPLPAIMLQRELRFPKGLEVVLALSLRVAPGVTRRGVLGDLATILRAQHNCATIVAALPCWPKPFIDLIDWKQAETNSIQGLTLGTAAAQLEEELDEIPVAVLQPEMLASHSSGSSDGVTEKPKRAMLSIDDFIEHSSTPVRGHGSRHFNYTSPTSGSSGLTSPSSSTILGSGPSRATMPGLTTSMIISSPALPSSMLMAHTEPLLPVSSAALRLIQTLLHHAMIHMKDGWRQVRHALALLRFAADYHDIPEMDFRSIRRQLLCGLFHLLAQTPANVCFSLLSICCPLFRLWRFLLVGCCIWCHLTYKCMSSD
jgi:hypothetical protein